MPYLQTFMPISFPEHPAQPELCLDWGTFGDQMDAAFDLTNLLRNWAWNSEQFNVQWVDADDGRRLIQVRVELGVLQMETTGRPDGLRPEGLDSYLHLCTDRLETDASTPIDSKLCGALRDEALQVFHRITAALTLGDLESVMHDADGILRRMDLCRRFQGDSAAFANLESLRPQTIMMRSRAGAELALAAGQHAAARRALSSGLEDLEACLGPTALKRAQRGRSSEACRPCSCPDSLHRSEWSCKRD